MSGTISFIRPQVNTVPTVTQKTDTDNLKAELNTVNSEQEDYKISDIAAMTRRINLESKLNDTKAAPVKYEDEIKTAETEETSGGYATNPDFENAVKSLRENRQYSLNEKDMMLAEQMNQMALSNKILHGLLI